MLSLKNMLRTNAGIRAEIISFELSLEREPAFESKHLGNLLKQLGVLLAGGFRFIRPLPMLVVGVLRAGQDSGFLAGTMEPAHWRAVRRRVLTLLSG